jgi:hypothetical protein
VKTDDKLKKLFSLLLKTAQTDPNLRAEIEQLWAEGESTSNQIAPHPRGRRKSAPFDPFVVHQAGETALQARLAELDIEALKDIVAEYGMDPAKLVLKWKSKERMLEHILSTVSARVKKGDAFRG